MKEHDYLPAIKNPEQYANRHLSYDYATFENVDEWFEELRTELLNKINDSRLLRITFCDDAQTKGIQVSGIHASEPGYVHCEAHLSRDLSNRDELIENFVAAWDATKDKTMSSFYRQGERWGWD